MVCSKWKKKPGDFFKCVPLKVSAIMKILDMLASILDYCIDSYRKYELVRYYKRQGGIIFFGIAALSNRYNKVKDGRCPITKHYISAVYLQFAINTIVGVRVL